jgi:MYXO-CTERM domain-containing protein
MTKRPWPAALFWMVALVAVLVGSFCVAYGTLLTAGPALDSASFNTWGDAEGLVVPFWIGYAVLVVLGLVGAFVIRRRRLRIAGGRHPHGEL